MQQRGAYGLWGGSVGRGFVWFLTQSTKHHRLFCLRQGLSRGYGHEGLLSNEVMQRLDVWGLGFLSRGLALALLVVWALVGGCALLVSC